MKRLVLSLILSSVTSAGWAGAQESAVPSGQGDEEVTALPVPSEEVAEPSPAPTAVAVAPASRTVAPVPLASLPPTQRYREHQAPPPGYVLEEQARRVLVIPGIALVGALYITGIITTGVLQEFPNKTGFLAIPVAGPWITWGTRTSSCDDIDSENSLSSSLDCDEDKALDRLLVLDGMLQAVGAALIVTGFTWTKSIWVREDLAHINVVPGLNVAKLPGLPEPHGLSLVGRF